MKKIFNYLILAVCALSLSSEVKAQDHVIGSEQNPRTKPITSSHNIGFVEKSNINGSRITYDWIISMDSINISSASILAGDSIKMLSGDVPALIFQTLLVPTQGTQYTSGSTDSVLVYSVVNDTSVKAFMLADTSFTSAYPAITIAYVTSDSDIDSCYIYLKIPASKFSAGTHSYVLYYWYIRKKE